MFDYRVKLKFEEILLNEQLLSIHESLSLGGWLKNNAVNKQWIKEMKLIRSRLLILLSIAYNG